MIFAFATVGPPRVLQRSPAGANRTSRTTSRVHLSPKTNMSSYFRLLVIFLLTSTVQSDNHQWRPCVELKRDLRVPCQCRISRDHSRFLEMNCDSVVLTQDAMESLRGQPIISLSRRKCGYQSLPADDVIVAGLSLLRLDLSDNSISKLMDRKLKSQTQIRELRLAGNALGDSLNPIFSSNEFHDMQKLRLLDLSRNGLRSMEEGILKGCGNLQELYLDGNNFTSVPVGSLKGPEALEVLSLADNNIEFISRGVFSTFGDSLIHLDLSSNELTNMEDGALVGLDDLLFLNLSHNDFSRFNSDVFKGAHDLLQLDLSTNFLQEFPSDALRYLSNLKILNISNNLITEIERTQLNGFAQLKMLDLSRNNIGRLGVNAFSGLTSLLKLDLSVNALRTIEESSFEGLNRLEWLSLQDNNILLIPGTALARLPSLAHLHVEFNRIAALSSELIRSTSSSLVSLGLSRNLVREIPGKLFQNFDNLTSIDLSGNMLSAIPPDMFTGLEDSLLSLDVSYNRLTIVNELPLNNLLFLNLAGNQLRKVPPTSFEHLSQLRYLNLSINPLYGGFPPVFPSSLTILDISYTDLKILPTVLFLNLESLEELYLVGNQLNEINAGTFLHIYTLGIIDMSYNNIELIENGVFVGLLNLQKLNLRGNMLTSFAGEHFDTGTSLEILDLSDNRIEHLSPTAFAIHPRLREINLSGNRFVQFPSEYVKPLQFLENLDLSRNLLKSIAEFAFSQMSNLRTLNLSGNKIESVEELVFHNSTQLQTLDLSSNQLEVLSDRTLEGLLRLELLNLRDNQLTSLPETIFDPSRIRIVERIDLSGNYFNEIPTRALQKQSQSLSGLIIARNDITELFSTQDVLNNVKHLDLSGNPLSANAVRNVLGEAKILRTLNLGNIGIKNITNRLETPFIHHLNLSGNQISDLKPIIFERTTMLETLDVSRNKLTGIIDIAGNSTLGIRPVLPSLRFFDISGNSMKTVNESSFDSLRILKSLKMTDLLNCTRIEKSAFKHLRKLRLFHAFHYPKLGYFDVQGILKDMVRLESLDIEVKDTSVGNEQLSIRSHPRLRELTLRGERLRTILSSSLVGVKASTLHLSLKNTSIDSVSSALFFPVPRSTGMLLDVSGSKFTTLPSQLLTAIDERSDMVSLTGLDSNPIICDCELKAFWNWLKSHHRSKNNIASLAGVQCKAPKNLVGVSLLNITEERLTCSRHPTTSNFYETSEPGVPEDLMSSMWPSSSSASTVSTVSEPEIIWTAAPTTPNNRNKVFTSMGNGVGQNVVTSSIGNSSGTDDTLIIGIVGGVVAFIAIIVIIICICRLRWSNMQSNEARMTAAIASNLQEASMMRTPLPALGTYPGKVNPDMYHLQGSMYNGSTLSRGENLAGSPIPNTPVQVLPYPMHVMYPTLPASPTQLSSGPPPQHQMYGYYENPHMMPMYMTCTQENKYDK